MKNKNLVEKPVREKNKTIFQLTFFRYYEGRLLKVYLQNTFCKLPIYLPWLPATNVRADVNQIGAPSAHNLYAFQFSDAKTSPSWVTKEILHGICP